MYPCWDEKPRGINSVEVNAWALCQVADAIRYAADSLGLNNANTSMGALEAVAQSIGEGFTRLARAKRP